MALTFSPAIISYASATVVAGNVVYPVLGGPQAFPKANCRQIVILNTSATTLYFGFIFAPDFASIPPPFNPAGAPIVAVLASNCSSIPAGGSFSLDLETYQNRGNFDPLGINAVNFVPTTVMFFSGAPATSPTATIQYINTYGAF